MQTLGMLWYTQNIMAASLSKYHTCLLHFFGIRIDCQSYFYYIDLYLFSFLKDVLNFWLLLI